MKPRQHWDELVRVYEETNRRRADTVMRDRTYDRLRTPSARRSLVAVVALFLVAVPFTALVAGNVAAVVVCLPAAAAVVLLKVSVRSLADVPEDCLDERQLALRHRVHHEAYRWLGLVAVLAGGTGVIAFMALDKDPSGDTLAVTWNQLMAFFYATTGLAIALPSMILALQDVERP